MTNQHQNLEEKQRPDELRVANFVPCDMYNLETLVNFKVLDLLQAVRVSGQEPSTFDDNEKYQALAQSMLGRVEQYGHKKVIRDVNTGRFKSGKDWEIGGFALAALVRAYEEHPKDYKLREYIINPDLVSKLTQAGVQVPEDKRAVFGDNFSKLIEYNGALQKPILTEADGASPEFREALYSWHKNLDPFSERYSSKQYFAKAKPGDGLEMVWGLAAYIRESLAAGRSPKKVGKVIDAKLGELLSWDSYFGKTPDTPLGQKIKRELEIIRKNSKLVFENYRRVNQFRDQFRDQIRALVELYSGSEWSKETQYYAYIMAKFLGEEDANLFLLFLQNLDFDYF